MPIRSTVYRDPKAVKGHRKRTAGGQMGGSPEAPTTASGRGNQPAGGDPESNPGCPGPRDVKRDGHNRLGNSVKRALSISDRAKVQSQSRSSPRRGNGCSRAQWETFKKWCGFGTSISKCWHHAAPGRNSSDILTEAFFRPPVGGFEACVALDLDTVLCNEAQSRHMR